MSPFQLKLPPVVNAYDGEAPVNWAGMNPKPYRALLECTKGQYYRDRECANYIQQCNDLGIKYGLYHFLFPNNIDEQVEIYIQTVDALGGPGHFPPIVDVEYTPPTLKKGKVDNLPRGRQWASQIKTWLDAVEAHYNQKPMIYTSANFWQYTFDSMDEPPAWTDHYPLWVAWYPNSANVDNRDAPREDRMPQGWTKFTLWQYSKSGRSNGHLLNDLNLITPEYQAELDALFP